MLKLIREKKSYILFVLVIAALFGLTMFVNYTEQQKLKKSYEEKIDKLNNLIKSTDLIEKPSYAALTENINDFLYYYYCSDEDLTEEKRLTHLQELMTAEGFENFGKNYEGAEPCGYIQTVDNCEIYLNSDNLENDDSEISIWVRYDYYSQFGEIEPLHGIHSFEGTVVYDKKTKSWKVNQIFLMNPYTYPNEVEPEIIEGGF